MDARRFLYDDLPQGGPDGGWSADQVTGVVIVGFVGEAGGSERRHGGGGEPVVAQRR